MTELPSESQRDAEAPLDVLVRRFSDVRFGNAESRYALTSFVLLRGVSLIYLVAFLIILFQFRPLFGEQGLLPAGQYLDWVAARLGSRSSGFARLPSVFWFGNSDSILGACALLGVALSAAGLAGFCNAIGQLIQWVLYLSFVHIGQIFYGYGWESLLCEAGFLSIFLAAPLDPRPFARSKRSTLMIVLYRWLTFRVMFGAGLIKLRGDPCWRDLTCLEFHYQSQPNPGPLSYYFHRLPAVAHRAGAVFNHLVELVAPFGVFGPRPWRLLAGASIVCFQVVLILSGNLSFLNWLTLVVALACFDDGVFVRCLPRSLAQRAAASEQASKIGLARRVVLTMLAVGVGFLSLNPVVNMLSSRQAMNASFDPFMLVNTYGAFGSVSRERLSAVIEGTDAAEPSFSARWQGYELPCQTGDPARRPCLVTPYHYRLDWQMWFVPLAPPGSPPEPWLVHLLAKLLEGDALVLSLFERNPFAAKPPRFVRVALYRYRFSVPGEAGYWQREYLGNLLPPLARDDPELVQYLRAHGFR
ncbi:MAG: lipase maturation factor family protein [Myxococcota bacterium]